jgi:hypothetical protein
VPISFNGCTPGYWKQSQHHDSWVGYDPSNDFAGVFGVNASFSASLDAALGFSGSGEYGLARHAAAALLNSASPGVHYAYTTAQVISMVKSAYASGQFEATKDLFAAQNELGCPLN